ncbi:MAG: helix-turn-helix domain-containing protein [Oscillospiraceae bacterium]|nr:helix-turn-helix domain-containing protein [Oscillospiraceae bacterium]
MENYQTRLKDLREDKDLTQAQIAKVIGTSQQHYGKYESGKIVIPFDRVIILADFYNVSLDYIAGRTNILLPFSPKGK